MPLLTHSLAIAASFCADTPTPGSTVSPATTLETMMVHSPRGDRAGLLAEEGGVVRPVLAAWDDRIQEAEETPRFGAEGSTRFQYSAGLGFEVGDTDPFAQAGVSWSYFFAENLSLDLELNGLYFSQDIGDDALGANANLLLRWHFIARDTWSVYGDGGAGLMVTTAHVPAVGSSINFTPQLGAGVSFDVGENRRVMTGIRWHHVSNGSTSEDNEGRDSAYFYATLSIPY